MGLYNYGARLYDPDIGRFISPDTIVPNYSNPQALNRYAYSLNNPMRFIDPTGHWPERNPWDVNQNSLLSINSNGGVSYGSMMAAHNQYSLNVSPVTTYNSSNYSSANNSSSLFSNVHYSGMEYGGVLGPLSVSTKADSDTSTQTSVTTPQIGAGVKFVFSVDGAPRENSLKDVTYTIGNDYLGFSFSDDMKSFSFNLGLSLGLPVNIDKTIDQTNFSTITNTSTTPVIPDSPTSSPPPSTPSTPPDTSGTSGSGGGGSIWSWFFGDD